MAASHQVKILTQDMDFGSHRVNFRRKITSCYTIYPIKQLDAALIRPGRIDLKLELNYADSELTANLFEFMYKPVGEAMSLTKAETMAIEQGAREFAAIIPEKTFSVAQIMSYIQQNWDSPTTALKNSREWVKHALQERENQCRDGNPRLLGGSVTSTAPEPAAESELEWLWVRNDAKLQNDIPRTRVVAIYSPPHCERHNNLQFQLCLLTRIQHHSTSIALRE